MMAFAEHWVAAWNRRDLETILAKFSEDAVFTSPTAERIVGRPTLEGKPALADYWRRALDKHAVLEFRLLHASWDPELRELNVVYKANRNGEIRRACEVMVFNDAGQQIRGEAFYGATI